MRKLPPARRRLRPQAVALGDHSGTPNQPSTVTTTRKTAKPATDSTVIRPTERASRPVGGVAEQRAPVGQDQDEHQDDRRDQPLSTWVLMSRWIRLPGIERHGRADRRSGR